MLPTTLLDLSIHEKELVSRQPPVRMPARPYCVIWHQRWDSHPAHRWLRQTIVSLFTRPAEQPGDAVRSQATRHPPELTRGPAVRRSTPAA